MVNIKGRGNKIEICFEKDDCVKTAVSQLEEKSSFLKDADMHISYSGTDLSYNDEMYFEKELKRLFGKNITLEKKRRLSKAQIEYSLDNGEKIIRVVNKSLRSGEVAESRGDLIVYGDVNPGALVKAYGNITVIGVLRGSAHIVGEGRVYAAYMQPAQIKIGKVCSYNKNTENVGSAVALAENGEIILQCL